MNAASRLLALDTAYLAIAGLAAVVAGARARRAAKRGSGASAQLLPPALAVGLAGLLVHPFSAAAPGSASFAFLRFLAHASLLAAPAICLVSGAFLTRGAVSRRIGGSLLGLGLLGSAISMDAYLIEPARLEVLRFRLPAPARARLERPLRIALVTDLQTDRVGRQQARALREVAALRPDLLLFGGDFLQVWTAAELAREADRLRPMLREAASAAGASFAVWGNVDPRGTLNGRDVTSLLFGGTAIQVLSDESRDVDLAGVVVRVTGLDLPTGFSTDPRVLAPVIPRPPAAGIHLVLSHAPDFVLGLDEELCPRADLALAGHIHGGQVVVPFLGPPMTLSRLPRELSAGLHRWRGLPLIVSKGVGLERGSAPRIRLFCPPDVVLVELVPP